MASIFTCPSSRHYFAAYRIGVTDANGKKRWKQVTKVLVPNTSCLIRLNAETLMPTVNSLPPGLLESAKRALIKQRALHEGKEAK